MVREDQGAGLHDTEFMSPEAHLYCLDDGLREVHPEARGLVLEEERGFAFQVVARCGASAAHRNYRMADTW